MSLFGFSMTSHLLYCLIVVKFTLLLFQALPVLLVFNFNISVISYIRKHCNVFKKHRQDVKCVSVKTEPYTTVVLFLGGEMGTLTRAEFVLQGVCTKIRKKFSDEIELFVKKKKECKMIQQTI